MGIIITFLMNHFKWFINDVMIISKEIQSFVSVKLKLLKFTVDILFTSFG